MTFTSNFFLIGLLPVFLILYRIVAGKNKLILKMMLLAAMNTLFYVFGGVKAFVFLLIFILITYLFAAILYKYKNRILFALLCIIVVLPLLFVKFSSVIMPLGISFFTFEAISFLADIYTQKYDKKPRLITVILYLSFFVTVTSGPIIKYKDFEEGVGFSKPVDYYGYIERIMLGLIKKMLIADKIAPLADCYFNGVANGNSYSVLGLWIGSIAYTLQLYFDFSGYSDIAIGIGGLCGFEIPENFDNPYQAKSISDFWKRWHITLSRWFRDYIYIPLGGNRCSVPRHIVNMFIVWIITGLWHGSDLTFVVWGIGYFVLLILEKYITKLGNISNHWYGHVYALFFINLLWIPFRADTIQTALNYVKGMFGFGNAVYMGEKFMVLEENAMSFIPILAIAIFMCMPVKTWITAFIKKYMKNNMWQSVGNIIKGIAIIVLMFLTVCAVVNSTYTPYIYGGF